jgi:hypothetical protein
MDCVRAYQLIRRTRECAGISIEEIGFSTDALFSDDRGQQVLQVVAVAGTLTPAAAAAASAEKSFVPGGGASGGAGASGKF